MAHAIETIRTPDEGEHVHSALFEPDKATEDAVLALLTAAAHKAHPGAVQIDASFRGVVRVRIGSGEKA